MSKYTTTINEYLNSELARMGFNEIVNNGKLTFFDEEFQFIQKIIKYDDDVHDIVTRKIFKGFQLPDVETDKHFKQAFVTRFLDREINRQTIESFASQVMYISITHSDYINEVFSKDFMMYVNNTSFSESIETGNMIGQTLNDTNTTNNDKSQSHENFDGNETSQAIHEESDINENRSAKSTLPQSEVNINVDNDELNYADENNITKSKDVKKATDESLKETTNQTDQDDESLSNSRTDSNTSQNQDTYGTSDVKQYNYDIETLQKIFDMKEIIFNKYDKKCFLHIW
ncbi:MAG: hypothetical protein E7K43_20775 [Bacillus subtilis]|nr:hypothetical protein [Bacillus subtilis]